MARINSVGVASYPEYAQASSGGATFPAFPVVNDLVGQTSPNHRLQFGDVITSRSGGMYMYVRASEALTVGQICRYSRSGDTNHPAAGTIAANTTTKQIFTTITTVIQEKSIGSMLLGNATSAGGGGTPFLKYIKGQVAIGVNTTFDISKTQIYQGIGQYDGDVLAGIPATGDVVAIIRPFSVTPSGSTASYTEAFPVGVAMGTVTALAGTLIQIQGIGQVMAAGAGGSYFQLVVGQGIVSAAAGIGTGINTTETAILDHQQIPAIVGQSLAANVLTTAALTGLHIKCLKNV